MLSPVRGYVNEFVHTIPFPTCHLRNEIVDEKDKHISMKRVARLMWKRREREIFEQQDKELVQKKGNQTLSALLGELK